MLPDVSEHEAVRQRDEPEVTWYSPLHPAVAVRYERSSPKDGWRITGLIASSRSAGLGAAWMKGLQWRRFASPHTAPAGVIWRGEPTVEILDEVYDAAGNLRTQSADLYRPACRVQIEPAADPRELLRSRLGDARSEQAVAWDELRVKLAAEGADEKTINAARKDFFYRRVADVYLTASRETGKPVEAVADAFNAPRTSAVNWVREARVRGYLPPTTKGRAT